MFKLPKDFRDILVNYLDNSQLPHGDVKKLVNSLMALEEIEDKKEEKK